MKVQAAAMTAKGKPFAVVLVPMELVNEPDEADLAIEALQPKLGRVPLVLMGQADDGLPNYHGDEELVRSLEGVPIDAMPWKECSA